MDTKTSTSTIESHHPIVNPAAEPVAQSPTTPDRYLVWEDGAPWTAHILTANTAHQAVELYCGPNNPMELDPVEGGSKERICIIKACYATVYIVEPRLHVTWTDDSPADSK